MDTGMSRLLIFMVIFNLLFTTFSYALTTFADEEHESSDLDLPTEKLLDYGITLLNATQYNITFGEDWTYFSYNDRDMRTRWHDGAFTADAIYFEKKTYVGEWLDSWFFSTELDVKFLDSGFVTSVIFNATLIAEWDHTENWSLIDIDYGVKGFFTVPPPSTNITEAIESGMVTLTVGEQPQNEYDWREFIDWYWASIFSSDYSSIPNSIQWVMRGLTLINVIVAIFAIRELSPI